MSTPASQTQPPFTEYTQPGRTPLITSLFDFSQEALGQLKLWLDQQGSNLPIQQIQGYIAHTQTQLAYAEKTSDTNITSTSGTSPTTIITSASLNFDGSTAIVIECAIPSATWGGGNGTGFIDLVDSSGPTNIYSLGIINSSISLHALVRKRYTPASGTHTFTLGGHVNASSYIASGTTNEPCYIRITGS